MAGRMASDPNRSQLETLLNRWEARWRTRQLLLYFPRLVMIALASAILVALLLMVWQVFPPLALIVVTSALVLGGLLLMALALRFSGKKGMESVRHFDQLFAMQERVSTAFELLDGRIQSVPELSAMQVNDALVFARNIDPHQTIRFEVRWREWAGALSLLMVLVVVLGVYTLLGSATENSEISLAAQAAIRDAAGDVRDMTEVVALDGGLTDQERESLLESLEVSLDELTGENITPEDAFIELGDLESELRNTAESIREEVATQNEALDAATEALQEFRNRPDMPLASQDTNPSESLQDTLEALQNALDTLIPEQMSELQQQLENAAEATSGEIPAVSQDLSDLLDALQSGDMQSAQDSLDEALDNLEALDGQQLERLETAEQLDDAANQAQQALQEVSESESGAEQAQAESPEDGDSQSNSADAPGGQSPSESQDNNQNTSDSGSPVLSSDPSGMPVEIQGQADTPPSDAEASSDSSESQAGGGSGEGEGGQQDTISEPSNSQDSNQADGEGVTEYQNVYVGEGINAQGSVNIQLEADASDSPTVEGDFQENPTGEASVPYNQVFMSYQDAANRALENDYVPLGMRDVVRDYFTSLAPTTNTGE